MSESSLVLTESASSPLGKIQGKKRWRARIIATGRGSKAYYTEEAMASGAAAFPVGTKINADHASWKERDERPEGSILSIIGAIATTPVVESDGLYAEVEFLDEYAPLIEQLSPIVGLSIHASAIATDEADDGLPIVTAFVPNPLNTVDVVTVPGADGRLLEIMESYNRGIIDTEIEKERIEKGMTPEDIAAIVAGVADALKPEPVEVPEDEEKVDIKAVTEAIVAADLPDVAREQVYAAIENGIDVEEAITAQRAYVDAIAKNLEVEIEESTPAVRKTTKPKDEVVDLSISAWRK